MGTRTKASATSPGTLTYMISLVSALVALPTLATPAPSPSVAVRHAQDFSRGVEDAHLSQQAFPVPSSKTLPEAGDHWLAVLPTLSPDELKEAIAHGQSKSPNFIELVREYSFGNTAEVAWGYILTKRYRVSLEALKQSWTASQPGVEIVRQILSEDLLIVKIQFVGPSPSPATLLLKQGDAVITPTITRGLYFAFPYATLDLNAKTTLIFTAGDRDFQWEVDLSRYK